MVSRMSGSVTIRSMQPRDWTDVARIYADGIRTGLATFETEVPDRGYWDAGHIPSCRLVAAIDGRVMAWAALSPTSQREVYRGVAEASIYVGEPARGRGVGSALLGELVACSEREGLWTLQAGIFPENEPSIRLHQRHGFRIVGTRERIGASSGRWRDVLLLERRSEIVAV
jgi:phosphinothricin acetyltransferase